MARLFILAALAFTTIGWGEVPPVYPKRLEAVLIHGIMNKTPLHIVTGELRDCEKNVVSDWNFYACTAFQSYALVNHTSTHPVHLQFDKVFVQYSKIKETVYRTYTFSGQWTDNSQRLPLRSKVALSVSHDDKNPTDLRGFLQLVDYGTREAIHAVEVPSAQ